MPLLDYLGIALAISIVLIVLFVLISADRRGRVWGWAVRFFSDSETIFWARLQMFLGALWALIQQTDWVPLLHAAGLGQYVPFAIVFMGLITEVARRRRATDL